MLGACGDEPGTGVLLVIDAEGRTREIVDALDLRTFGGPDGPTSPTGEQRYDLPLASPWPVLIGLTPRRNDTDRVWGVEIRALRVGDGTGDLQLVRRVIGTYSKGRTVVVRVALEDLCLLERNRELLCGDTVLRTCLTGECRDTPTIDADELPTWDGARPGELTDAGGDAARSEADGGRASEGGLDAGEGGDGRVPPEDAGRRDTSTIACTGDAECDDGVGCTGDHCVDGACEHTPDDARCPQDACTAAVRCVPDDPGAGAQGCLAQPLACDDGIGCTVDGCDAVDGCQHLADDSRCGAGATCDLAIGGCRGGSCASAADCPDADPCTLDLCASGTCEHRAMACDDGNVCTDDRCDPGTGMCTATPNAAFCDDGLGCTTGDRCASGACRGAAVSCGGDTCSTGSCDEATAMCRVTTLPDGSACGAGRSCCAGRCTDTMTDPAACGGCGLACADHQSCGGGACTCQAPWLDCTPAPGCETDPATDPQHCGRCANPCPPATPSCIGGTCRACTSSGDCTPSLTCQTGTCSGGACSFTTSSGFCVIAGACVSEGTLQPGNACRSCQPAISATSWSPRSGACDDGLFCTVANTCSAGTCGGAMPRDCSDARSCTTDGCDEAADACTHVLLPGFCLIAGLCQPDGTPNPMNPCQVCDVAMSTSTWSPALGGSCSDGLFCTVNECNGAGSCGVIGMTSCADSEECTTDSCNELLDRCDHDPVTDGTPCSLGSCQGGVCTSDEDASVPRDMGPPADSGPPPDMGPPPDAGPPPDSGPEPGDMGAIEEDGAIAGGASACQPPTGERRWAPT